MPALLAAAVCVPLLLALYLLKLRRRPVRVDAPFLWPKAADDVQANVPLRWLRPSWLLLLHLLLLAALLLALARPALHGDPLSGERVVLVIDASASMSARDASSDQTRLDMAKRRAQQLTDQLSGSLFAPRRSVAVVVLAGQARLASGWTSSTALLRAAIDAIEPTDQPGNLPSALALVDAILADTGDDNERTSDAPGPTSTVLLLSDGAFSSADAFASGDAALPPLPSGFVFERVGPAPATTIGDNVGITALAAQRDALDPALVRVFARLTRSRADALDMPIELLVDGAPMARRAVRLAPPAGAPQSLAEHELTVDVRPPSSSGLVLTLRLAQPDALAADDSASVVLPPARAPRVALVRPAPTLGIDSTSTTPTATPTTTPTIPPTAPAPAWLLGDALREVAAGGLIELSPAQAVQRAGDTQAPPIDLWVFDGVAPTPAMGFPSPPSAPTVSLGVLPALTPTLASVPSAEALAPVPLRAGGIFWDRSHPLLRSVTLDVLTVAGAMRAGQLAAGVPGAQVLVRSDDTPLVVALRTGPTEHVVVAFDLAQSNWPLLTSFPLFLANVVEQLTAGARSREGLSQRTDQPLLVRAQAGTTTIELDGPAALRVSVPPSTASAPGMVEAAPTAALASIPRTLSAGLPPRAGVYRVAGGVFPPGVPSVLAANLTDRTETSLASPATLAVAGAPLAGVSSVRTPQEIWHWFILAAFALLCVEWLLYARQARA